MMECIFFDANLRDRFVQHARGMDALCDLRDDHMGMVVAVSEDLAEDLVDILESL